MEWIILGVIGLVIGWVAGKIMKGGGFGLIGDLIVGLLGMLLGGWLAGLVGLVAYGLPAQIGLGVVGACILIWVIRLVKKA